MCVVKQRRWHRLVHAQCCASVRSKSPSPLQHNTRQPHCSILIRPWRQTHTHTHRWSLGLGLCVDSKRCTTKWTLQMLGRWESLRTKMAVFTLPGLSRDLSGPHWRDSRDLLGHKKWGLYHVEELTCCDVAALKPDAGLLWSRSMCRSRCCTLHNEGEERDGGAC